jgi:RNA polymerase sigma-70 factor (ECF subfamily)
MSEEAGRGAGTHREDAGWVAAFQKGDKKAFDRLVLKYQRTVFNVCYRFLGNYDDANDSAQETFVKVYRSLKRFRGDARFSTWLYRIAVNTCKNRVGSLAFRMGRKTERIDAPKDEDGDRGGREPASENAYPNGAYERKEKMRRIQKAIDTLPADQKSIVILRDIEGLTYEEIGGITGLRPGTVKSRLSRARHQLRNLLKDVI